MRTIWKYTLDPKREVQALTMSEGAVVLHVHEQRQEICLWVDHVSTRPTTQRRFEVFGTGWEMPTATRVYLGTAHIGDGGSPLVFHVYERIMP
jgi:hypothetical protein